MSNYVQIRVHRCAPILPFARRSMLMAGLFSALLTATDASFATDATFDLDAFSSGITPLVDISRFNTSNLMSPGTYRVDIVVNGQRIGRRDVEFVEAHSALGAQACMSREMLDQLGIVLEATTAAAGEPGTKAALPAEAPLCGDLGQWLPMATSTFDVGSLEWSASVPQVFMKQSVRGYVDPSYWDEGIDAGLLNYNLSASTITAGENEDRAYLGLNGGVNIGSWRFRHQGAQAWDAGLGLQTYQNTATYLQRSIVPWQSQLIVGDSFSSGQILEGVRVRGITLATDERMLPQSQQGYAPQVRGIADTNAIVTVSQNGYTIYETTVSPGPFVISDLFATGYGGDLNVAVTEVDGRRNTFIVPYSVAPQLLRSDSTKYSATFGQVRQRGVQGDSPTVFQGTLQRGLTDDLTLYGGGTLSKGYGQTKLGVAMSTPYGAFSLDASRSRTRVADQGPVSGHSFGLGYNKNLPTSGTHFVLGAYRFSTAGYMGLFDALNVRELARLEGGTDGYARQKSRLDLTLSQKLGEGTLSLYGSSIDYWSQLEGRQTSYTVSYGATWRKVNWNLSAQRSRIEDSAQLSDRERGDEVFFGPTFNTGRTDTRFVLTLSMPLGGEMNSPTLSSSLSRDTGDVRGSQQQVGVNGLLGEYAEGSYGIAGSRATSDSERSSSVNVYAGYRSSSTNLRAGYGQTRDSAQLSLSADGGVVAHAGGVTLAQHLGEASALVHVPNAQGAGLSNASGVRVDRNGYAVVPSLRAFQNNVVGVDPHGTALDVELQESTQTVVPTLGAMTLLRFVTVSGRAVVVKAIREEGGPLPFAAQVLDAQGKEVGVIGQASKAFVRGIAEEGTLTVKWGDRAADQCEIHYRLPPPVMGLRQDSVDQLQGQCLTGQARQVAGQP